ncbi:hypothetical protein Q5752_004183 [Cryptotrichosporon argae]
MRSGLQQDVINLYRQGLRNVYSKAEAVRPAFLLHLRYSFHHPRLTRRDYIGIEHQLRRMARTIEMLSEPSVQRINVSADMAAWWAGEVARVRAGAGAGAGAGESVGSEQGAGAHEGHHTASHSDGRDGSQWGGKLPGHGGT